MTNLEAISTLGTQIVVLRYYFLLREVRVTQRAVTARFGAKNILVESGLTPGLMSKDSEANLRKFTLAKDNTSFCKENSYSGMKPQIYLNL